jgi:hypothetical protein
MIDEPNHAAPAKVRGQTIHRVAHESVLIEFYEGSATRPRFTVEAEGATLPEWGAIPEREANVEGDVFQGSYRF